VENAITTNAELVVGIDLGNKESRVAVLSNETGEVLEEAQLRTRPSVFEARFTGQTRMRIVLEAGAHSPWASRLLSAVGHEVIVANPREVRAIYASKKKTDRFDAVKLAQLGRVDARLLHPVEHRTEQQQADLSVVRARENLVKCRTQLVNHVRGSVKSFGVSLSAHSTRALATTAAAEIPAPLLPALQPVLTAIESLDQLVRESDRQIELLTRERYPETELLTQVYGVGPITALTFRLTIGHPERFRRARSVGAYLGLTPRLDSSGDQNPQLGISKAGNELLRKLLVGCAQVILRKNAPDTTLKRFGLGIALRGGKNAKKRAVVAVARKLAVMAFVLWRDAAVWEPLRGAEEPVSTTEAEAVSSCRIA